MYIYSIGWKHSFVLENEPTYHLNQKKRKKSVQKMLQSVTVHLTSRAEKMLRQRNKWLSGSIANINVLAVISDMYTTF